MKWGIKLDSFGWPESGSESKNKVSISHASQHLMTMIMMMMIIISLIILIIIIIRGVIMSKYKWCIMVNVLHLPHIITTG